MDFITYLTYVLTMTNFFALPSSQASSFEWVYWMGLLILRLWQSELFYFVLNVSFDHSYINTQFLGFNFKYVSKVLRELRFGIWYT